MNNYLIFRTDRIGDFLLTAILIKSIKRNDPSSLITVVASTKNYNYINSFEIIDQVFVMDDNILNKLKLIHLLNRNYYQAIIIHDSKNRSKIISFFLKKKMKISLKINNTTTHISDIKKILEILSFNFNKSDLNTLEQRPYERLIKSDLFHQKIDNFILLHFDEKWLQDQYISKYTNIEPTVDELIYFFESIISKTKKNLFITTGVNNSEILNKIFLDNTNSKLHLFRNLNFLDLEFLLSKSHMLISCHGAISHVAASKNIKQIDIIDDSYNYNKWSAHFRSYHKISRDKFLSLSKEILRLL